MKKTFLLLMSLFCVGVAGAVEKQTRVKLATLVPKGTSYHAILQTMGEKWRQAPGGGVALTIYTDGTMGGEADMVRRMRVGQLQAGLLTVTGLAEIDESVRALQNMPMVFRSLDEVDYVRTKLQPRLEKKFADKGFVILFWGYGGWVRFFSRQPAFVPDDFKRMKMFAWAGDNNTVDIMKSLGYQPVPLEPTDILTGLQTKLIDSVPSTPFYALAGQFFGPAPHMLEINWVPLVGGAVVTKKTWDALPAETRAALRAAADEAGVEINKRSRIENDEAVAAMQKRGLQVHPATPEIEAAWVKIAESVHPKIRGKIVPAETFDEVIQLLADYRAGKR